MREQSSPGHETVCQSSDYFKLLKIEDDTLKMAAILKQLRLNVC